MSRDWIRRGVAGLLAAASLILPTAAAQVEINGTRLGEDEGWIHNGTSYVTLQALSREADYSLDWDGTSALLEGGDVSLSAQPGAIYVEVNGRALYLPGGVHIVEGRTALPLRLLEEALGGEVSWDSEEQVASLDTRQASAKQADYSQEDLYWLSRIISAESRGESLLGQIAVGNVVLNRVRSKQYPNTVKGVVFDRNNGVQFEPVSNGTIYLEPTASSILAAKLALEGADVVGESLYFYAPSLSAGTWIVNNCTYYATIGCHRFYL